MISELDAEKKRLRASVRGDVTSSNVAELRSVFVRLGEATPSDSWKVLYLDLRNARIVDSMGLNWIFQLTQSLRAEGKSVVVQISSPLVERLMLFAGLDRLVTLKFRKRRQIG